LLGPNTFACSFPLSPTHTWFTFCKLRTFDVNEFFFLYGPPTLKTLCDLTSFCYCKASLPSHTLENQTQKGKRKRTQEETKNKQETRNQKMEKYIYIDGNRKK